MGKPVTDAGSSVQEPLVFGAAFGDVAAEHAEPGIDQNRQTDVVENPEQKKAQNQKDQGHNGKKLIELVGTISTVKKTLKPTSHKYAFLYLIQPSEEQGSTDFYDLEYKLIISQICGQIVNGSQTDDE